MRLGLIKTGASAEYDDEFMEAMASEYERMTPWTRMRLANVKLLVDPKPGDRVLDIGSAAGAIVHYLSTLGCEPVGVDLSELGVQKARERFPGLRFEVGDAAQLPFEDASFDKVVAADVTEHLDEATLRGMFAESRRVLVAGGTLSIHTPNPKHLIERMKAHDFLLAQNPTHIGLRTSRELRGELERAGFTIELDLKRPSFYPVLRVVDRLFGPTYRICIRSRR